MSKKNYHILFSARDIGAAYQIKEIARAFKKDAFSVSVVASNKALDFLNKTGLNPIRFQLKNKRGYIPARYTRDELSHLLSATGKILSSERPDIVFCGLTTENYGIDEAILYLASKNRLNIPSFQFLDMWGAFNHLKDGYPDMYFAIDEYSQKYCFKGARAPIKVVGSPKHRNYFSKPIDKWRSETRKKLGIDKNTRLVGYFGQDPSAPGQAFNFLKLAEALQDYSKTKPCKLLFRPHPTYKTKYAPYRRHLSKMDFETIYATNVSSVEKMLSACDLVATCFSTVGVDHAYLTSYAQTCIGAVLYLLCGKEIKKHVQSKFGYWRLPLVEQGIGFYVDDHALLLDKLKSLLDFPDLLKKYFAAAKALRKNSPCKNIIKEVNIARH